IRKDLGGETRKHIIAQLGHQPTRAHLYRRPVADQQGPSPLEQARAARHAGSLDQAPAPCSPRAPSAAAIAPSPTIVPAASRAPRRKPGSPPAMTAVAKIKASTA